MNQDRLAKRYLMGTLSDEERAGLEEQYFADNNAFEELEIGEEELVDAYVRGELSASDREHFERNLLSSPRLIERIQFARTLAKSVSTGPLSQLVHPGGYSPIQPPLILGIPPWRRFLGPIFAERLAFRMAVAACLVFLAIGGGALIIDWTRLRVESRRLESEREAIQKRRQELERPSAEQRSKTDQLSAELQNEQDRRANVERLLERLQRAEKEREKSGRQASVPQKISLALFPGLNRSTPEQHNLILRPRTSTVRLQLAVETDLYAGYRAVVRTAEHAEVFHQDGLKVRRTRVGPAIVLQFPASRLSVGDYLIIVSGATPSGTFEPVADFSFRVITRPITPYAESRPN